MRTLALTCSTERCCILPSYCVLMMIRSCKRLSCIEAQPSQEASEFRVMVMVTPGGNLARVRRGEQVLYLAGLKAYLQPLIVRQEERFPHREASEQLDFTRGELKHLLYQIKRGRILPHQDVSRAVRWNGALLEDQGMLTDNCYPKIMLAGTTYQIFQE